MNKTIVQYLESRAVDDDETPFALFEYAIPLSAYELNLFAGGGCAKLKKIGVHKGSRVAIIGIPGHNLLAMLFACWKLGAIPTPIDLFATKEQVERILDSLEPSCLVVTSDASSLTSIVTLTINRQLPLLHLNNIVLPKITIQGITEPEDIALCLYTSGSTGIPKGVMCSHNSLLTGASYVIEAQSLSAKDRALCVLPLSHMNGIVTTLLAPLISNGSVAYMQPPFKAISVLELIHRFQCTWFSATPTHYSLLTTPRLNTKDYDLSQWRFCRSASAPLHPKILSKFEEHYGVPIIETMGMTESSGQIFSNPLSPCTRKPGSVGLPVGFQVRLVDNGTVIDTPNVVGEIQVRGLGLMSGYWGDKEETTKAYSEDWLKSGDLAKRDEDGYYYIVGRIKDIAIINGFNVSLKILEDIVLDKLPVFDAAATGVPDEIFGERINLYLIRNCDDRNLSAIAKQARKLVGTYLPTAQALDSINFVESFPRSQVGKTLKGRLREASILFSDKRSLSNDPRELLASVLDIDPATIDNSLVMGSITQWDSLAYISLLAATEKVLERELKDEEITKLMAFEGLCSVMVGESERNHRKPLPKWQENKAIAEIIKILLDAGYGDRPATHLILGFAHCANKGVKSPTTLLTALLDVLPKGHTLLMNGFTWRFCQGVSYHHAQSPVETGFINELFRKHPDTKRGNHPIYSILAQGPLAEELILHECCTCWGEGSAVLKSIQRKDVRTINYGLPVQRRSLLRGNTGLHALEELGRVPYRFFKKFTGNYNFGDGYETYTTKLYVRKGDIANTWDPLLKRIQSLPGFVYNEEKLLIGYDSHLIYEHGMELINENPFIFIDE